MLLSSYQRLGPRISVIAVLSGTMAWRSTVVPRPGTFSGTMHVKRLQGSGLCGTCKCQTMPGWPRKQRKTASRALHEHDQNRRWFWTSGGACVPWTKRTIQEPPGTTKIRPCATESGGLKECTGRGSLRPQSLSPRTSQGEPRTNCQPAKAIRRQVLLCPSLSMRLDCGPQSEWHCGGEIQRRRATQTPGRGAKP